MKHHVKRIARGHTAQVAAYVGPAGELVMDIDAKALILQDGKTAGGVRFSSTPVATSVPWSEVTDKPSSYTPAPHTHGNFSDDGKIGDTSGLPLITTTGGVVTTGSFGTAAGTFCQGNDSRLSVFGASGANHKAGLVPDPGVTAGSTRYLREDGIWVAPPNINTDTLMTQNVSTVNATYPILLVATANAMVNQGAKTGIFCSGVKVNPSTSEIIALKFTGALSGNAGTATKFALAQSVTLTGDVTGSVSSQAGWSVPTTLANSGVTAGSYGPANNVTLSHSESFSVPYFTVDAKGRITAASTKTITLPASETTWVMDCGEL